MIRVKDDERRLLESLQAGNDGTAEEFAASCEMSVDRAAQLLRKWRGMKLPKLPPARVVEVAEVADQPAVVTEPETTEAAAVDPAAAETPS